LLPGFVFYHRTISAASLFSIMKTILILAVSVLGNAVPDYTVVTNTNCSDHSHEEVSPADCKLITKDTELTGLAILHSDACTSLTNYADIFSRGLGPAGCHLLVNSESECMIFWGKESNSDAFDSHNIGVCQEAATTTTTTAAALPSANQDPHITNAYGKHFELRQDGRYNMLSVARKNVSEFKLFADLFRIDEKPCAPAYIRNVNIVTGQTTFSIRRGIQNNSSASNTSDGFDVRMEDQDWIPHSRLEEKQYNIGDLKLDLGGIEDCRDSVNVRRDCRHVVVVSPHVQVRVEAGQSPNSKRFFLNLQIVKLDSLDATVSGVLWGDTFDQLTHC